jgi:hypothetical protein
MSNRVRQDLEREQLHFLKNGWDSRSLDAGIGERIEALKVLVLRMWTGQSLLSSVHVQADISHILIELTILSKDRL